MYGHKSWMFSNVISLKVYRQPAIILCIPVSLVLVFAYVYTRSPPHTVCLSGLWTGSTFTLPVHARKLPSCIIVSHTMELLKSGVIDLGTQKLPFYCNPLAIISHVCSNSLLLDLLFRLSGFFQCCKLIVGDLQFTKSSYFSIVIIIKISSSFILIYFIKCQIVCFWKLSTSASLISF